MPEPALRPGSERRPADSAGKVDRETAEGYSGTRWLDRLLEVLLILYLVALPISVAAGNVFAALLLVAIWIRPLEAWRRLRERLSPGLIMALLALPVVVLLFSLGHEPGQGQMWEMIAKQRKVLLISLAPFICQSAAIYARARLAAWVAGGLLAGLTWLFLITGQGLYGPFDPEVPVTITHTYQNYFVGFTAVWLGAWSLRHRAQLSRWQQGLVVIALVLMVGSVLFVVTGRAGQAAFAVMTIVAIFLGMRRWRWLAMLVAMLGIATALAASPQVRDRWLSIVDSLHGVTTERALPATLRLHYLANTLVLIREAPILGHGTGQFPIAYERVSHARPGSHFAAVHPHSDLLLYWTEAGLAGVAALLALYIGMVRAARVLPLDAALALQVLVAGFIVGGLTHTFQLDYVSGAYFYSMAGLLLAAPRGPPGIRAGSRQTR